MSYGCDATNSISSGKLDDCMEKCHCHVEGPGFRPAKPGSKGEEKIRRRGQVDAYPNIPEPLRAFHVPAIFPPYNVPRDIEH